jgi:glycine dehydrogenase
LHPKLPVRKRYLATAAEATVDQNDGMPNGAAVLDGGIDSHEQETGKSRQLWQDFSYRLAHTSRDMFAKRHIGPDTKDTAKMLASLSPAAQSLDDFVAQVIPPDVLSSRKLQLDPDRDINIQDNKPRPETWLGYLEKEVTSKAHDLSRKNVVANNFIGLGYYGTHTPDVIKQNILQNPAWYTSYTPYQPEISQGRLESLLNFQTMVSDLTGLAISNASLLDEGTAAAEAMTLSVNALPSSRAKGKDKTFVVSDGVNPHTVAVLRGRAEGFGVNVVVENVLEPDFKERLSSFGDGLVGVMVQYPDVAGRMHAFKDLADLVHAEGGLLSCATDLLALTHYTPPGEWGADIAFGNAQRFGVPLGNGGPHAAFFAVTEKHKRKIPGRLVGVSKDRLGGRALRLALQTREQHIRREKATSNVCTAQALLANMSAMYAVYHGAQGLRHIAEHAHGMACTVQHMARIYGWEVDNKKPDFDTVTIGFERGAVTITRELNDAPRAYVTNVRPLDSRRIAISCDETTTKENVVTLFQALLKAARHQAARYQPNDAGFKDLDPRGYLRGSNVSQVFDVARNKYRKDAVEEFRQGEDQSSRPLRRTSPFLTHPVFNTHHSETELLRYMHHLQSKDLSLVHSMIPLGSCTMKLNGATEMSLITQPRWANIHPRAPETQTRGYEELIKQLSHQLATITAMDAVSLQPNSGAQGEFTGLRVIRKYHESNGQANRDICLIPVSAHGTNPASAAMAGMRVVPIKCDTKTGNLDIKDLEEKCAHYSDQLAAMMITYPSTYGVFEPQIKRVCEIVHDYGGQVYMDGANMNAQIGLCAPGEIGADVCHLNLHKTFCIPHGGGGPGVGPICVKQHLAGYLPSTKYSTKDMDNPPVSSAPFGSASILPISWAYNLLMGMLSPPIRQ